MPRDKAALAKERRESAQAIAARDKAIAARAQAIAERDFVLKFVQDLADAVWRVDALAVAGHLRTLRAMAALAEKLPAAA